MQATPGAAAEYCFSLPDELTEGCWVGVRGPGVPGKSRVRVTFQGGRFGITGIHIEADEPLVTANLRSFRLGDVREQLRRRLLDAVVTRRETADDAVMQGLGLFIITQTKGSPGEMVIHGHPSPAGRAAIAGLHVRTQLEPLAKALAAVRTRGAPPPTTAELHGFASLYSSERRDQPYGALKRTAESLNIHRATANRWVKRCEQAGLLPHHEGPVR